MKTFDKWFGGLLLAFGLMVVLSLNSSVMAGSLPRSPKDVFVSSYTTGLMQVTPAVSTNSVTNAAFMPGAVYQVELASGAASEFFALYDSTGAAGITCGNVTNGSNQIQLTARLLFSSTTADTDYKFDPPLRFDNGLVACDSAITGQAAITYELGRGLSGN